MVQTGTYQSTDDRRARYLAVAGALMRSIDAGRFGALEVLPAERALSEEFDVSRDTIRKAIKLLEARGYLVSRQGSGTFVAPAALRHMRRSIEGFSDEARQLGREAGQRILSLARVPAPPDIAGALAVAPGAGVMRLRRLRLLDGSPVGLHDSHLALDQPDRLTVAALVGAGSLYRLLGNTFGLTLGDATERIGAVAANAEEAALLAVGPGAPLLRIERVTLGDDLRPVEVCDMRYARGYRYDTVISRRTGGL